MKANSAEYDAMLEEQLEPDAEADQRWLEELQDVLQVNLNHLDLSREADDMLGSDGSIYSHEDPMDIHALEVGIWGAGVACRRSEALICATLLPAARAAQQLRVCPTQPPAAWPPAAYPATRLLRPYNSCAHSHPMDPLSPAPSICTGAARRAR